MTNHRSKGLSIYLIQGLNLRTYPTSQTIIEGREVVFQCRDEGPLRARVAWRRGNGLPLPDGTRDNRGRLEMPNVQVFDRCKRITAKVTLTILFLFTRKYCIEFWSYLCDSESQTGRL